MNKICRVLTILVLVYSSIVKLKALGFSCSVVSIGYSCVLDEMYSFIYKKGESNIVFYFLIACTLLLKEGITRLSPSAFDYKTFMW